MAYTFMKYLESAPRRYDHGMRLVTAGRLEMVYRDIAALLTPGEAVLDVGCGTGTLAILLANRGLHVTGIDISAPMLNIALHRVRQRQLERLVQLRCMSTAELDIAFADASYDAVTIVLVLSEMGEDEVAYTLAQCWRVLGCGGRILVADEVVPRCTFWRAASVLLRFPWSVLSWLLAGTTSRPIGQLQARLEQAGFRVARQQEYLLGTLRLVEARRASDDV